MQLFLLPTEKNKKIQEKKHCKKSCKDRKWCCKVWWKAKPVVQMAILQKEKKKLTREELPSKGEQSA